MLEALPVQDGRARPAGGVAGTQPGLALGVTPHCRSHGRCLLRSERGLEADDAGGLETDRISTVCIGPLCRSHDIDATE
jgi:hypothetical protein